MCCESRLDVKILSLAMKNIQVLLDISRSLIRVVALKTRRYLGSL